MSDNVDGLKTSGITKYLDAFDKAVEQTVAGVAIIRQSLQEVGPGWLESARKAEEYAARATMATVTTIASIYQASSQQILSTTKAADSLGITTEAMAGLQYAAERTGATNIEESLQQMTKNLGEAAQGSGAAKDALDGLGLSAGALSSMSPDQAFAEIAEAMQGVGTQSDKVRIAMDLFGGSGGELVNTLALGKEGLQDVAVEAQNLGIAFSQVDAAKVQAAHEAITRVKAALEGAANTLTIQLAPYIAVIGDKLADAAKEGGGLKDKIIAVAQFGLKAAAKLGDAFRGWELIFASLQVAWDGVGAGIMAGLAGIDAAMTKALNFYVGKINSIIEMSNKFLGTEFQLVPEFQESDAIKQMAEDAKKAFDESFSHLETLAAQPLPSESLDKWLEEVNVAAAEAGEAMAAAKTGGEAADEAEDAVANAATGGQAAGGEGGEQETSEADAERAKWEEKLAAIEEGLASQEELENAAYERKLEMLNNANEQLNLSDAKYKELKEGLAAKHEGNLLKIKQKADKQQKKFSEMDAKGKFKFAAGVTNDLVGLAGAAGQELFKKNKAASLAIAGVKTIEAVIGAYASGASQGGPWLGALYAAVAAAAGISYMSQLSSASYGGGGGGAVSTAGGSVPSAGEAMSLASSAPEVPGDAAAGDATAAGEQAGSSTNLAPIIHINVEGHVVDEDDFARKIYNSLEKAKADGIMR